MIGQTSAFQKQKISTMLQDFDRSIFVVNEQTWSEKIENIIVSDIINNKNLISQLILIILV